MIERGKRTPRPVLAQKIGFALGFDWTIFFANESNEMTHSKAVWKLIFTFQRTI